MNMNKYIRGPKNHINFFCLNFLGPALYETARCESTPGPNKHTCFH